MAGLLLMLLGIGQRTIWAPAETVTVGLAEGSRSAPVTVIEAGALGTVDGPVEVTVEAEDPFVLAVGRSSDVEAWVGDAAHLSVTGASEDTLSSEYADGEDTVPDPRGSDLWISEEPGDGALTYRWEEPADGDLSILLAGDGESAAPADVSITRPNDTSTPFALPLIIGGALVVVLGIALLLVPPRRGAKRDSDAVGGTRAHARIHADAGRPGGASSIAAPGPVLLVAGLIGAGSLVGITPGMATTSPSATATASPSAAPSASATASPSAAASSSSATPSASATASPSATASASSSSAGSEAGGPPVVLASQLERILGSVATTIAEADAASDAESLAQRVGGAALDLRTGSYAVRAKDAQAAAPAPIAADPVLLDMIPAGAGWPRTIVALTQGDDNPVPQALLLVQATPRENYKLTSAVQMLPGSTFPSAPPPGAGGVVPLDEAGALTTAPQAAVASIADLLTKPTDATSGIFEENSFSKAITDFQAGVVADPGNNAADITFTHTADGTRTQALPTADGGAMVFGYLTHTYSSVPKGAGDSIDLKGTVYQSLTGKDSSEKGIDVNYGEAVMMYVPAAGSDDKIRVIGAAQQLLAAALR